MPPHASDNMIYQMSRIPLNRRFAYNYKIACFLRGKTHTHTQTHTHTTTNMTSFTVLLRLLLLLPLLCCCGGSSSASASDENTTNNNNKDHNNKDHNTKIDLSSYHSTDELVFEFARMAKESNGVMQFM